MKLKICVWKFRTSCTLSFLKVYTANADLKISLKVRARLETII